MEPCALDFIKPLENIDMDKFIMRINKTNSERVGVYPHWGGWFDIGQWEEYKKSLTGCSGITGIQIVRNLQQFSAQ